MLILEKGEPTVWAQHFTYRVGAPKWQLVYMYFHASMGEILHENVGRSSSNPAMHVLCIVSCRQGEGKNAVFSILWVACCHNETKILTCVSTSFVPHATTWKMFCRKSL